jgi:hypothetical protein
MDILNTGFSRMTFVAREYCELVDDINNMPTEQWLLRMADVLPRLHEAVRQLHTPPVEEINAAEPDIEVRFDLFSRIYQVVGERDGYSPDFDLQQLGQRLSGSLADDLTDIYFDLKKGIQLQESYPDKPALAIQVWQRSYQLHWRHHLEDAQRHFSDIKASRPRRH